MIKTEIETMNDIPLTNNEVKHVLYSMNSKKVPGIDGINAIILEKVFELFPISFVSMYSKCLSGGSFPRIWKE